MSLTICGGSKTYNIATSKCKFQYDRFQLLNSKGKTALQNDFDLTTKEIIKMNNTEFIKYMVKKMKLANILIHLLGYFHEQIVKLYMTIIIDSNKPFSEGQESKPSNYTPLMTRLSNIIWNEYPENKLKGFCPYEPLVRIQQLLDFPIEHFGLIEIVDLCDLPKTPFIDDTKSSQDLYTRILEARGTLEEYELYYIELCKYIEKLSAKLQNFS